MDPADPESAATKAADETKPLIADDKASPPTCCERISNVNKRINPCMRPRTPCPTAGEVWAEFKASPCEVLLFVVCALLFLASIALGVYYVVRSIQRIS